MAKIVLVHGAFNELWGPSELKSRWLPALCDGLWHHGVEVDDHTATTDASRTARSTTATAPTIPSPT